MVPHRSLIEIQQTQTGVVQMNSDKIVASVPWSKVIVLIAKLVRYSKGGISKEEGADLAEDLLLIVADLVEKK